MSKLTVDNIVAKIESRMLHLEETGQRHRLSELYYLNEWIVNGEEPAEDEDEDA